MPHETTVRVRYEETDQMRVVYHSNYLVYFEVGRSEMLRSLKLPYTEMEDKGIVLAVTEAQASYHKPARYDDLLTVRTRIEELGKSRIKLCYQVLRAGELLCDGHTTHAFLAAEQGMRPVRVPDYVRAALEPLIETSRVA
ncbi:MAG: acyl-CoA thioesterase [Planctomycetes bacterium]|nr:acyl-CoA thioesterase [Planctomycetota bacterium]NUQ33678.1 acyl-CoA thioesterase [Planctomycetaceae bacterium]